MRFMMLMIPKGYANAAADCMPSAEAVAAMMKYNQAMKDAGVLLSCEGLHPPAKSARVAFADGKSTVMHGPFRTPEALGGYWMIQVKSLDEAIAWTKRCPVGHDAVIEIRQVQEFEDFPADVQKAAGGLR
ncbi:MAG: YciI family protein [Alphaproteobacteria bacterium]|nr:YciI family protein [Alphaproteobacteria bacterium]